MRTKRCKRCGQPFFAERVHRYLCDSCRTQAKSDTVIRQRICKTCNAEFAGGPRAMYCPDCRIELKRARDREYHKRPAARPIGSIDLCVICGEEYIVNAGLQKYCKKCAPEAVREKDAATAREYARANKEKMYAHKMSMAKDGKVCKICGNPIQSTQPTVTCSAACAKINKSRAQARADLKRGRRKTLPPEAEK